LLAGASRNRRRGHGLWQAHRAEAAVGPNNPSGFILTTVLGIVGAFVATFLGQAIGWYRPDQGASAR